jgi:REP element-mobilizing transposase RayT
MTLFKNTYRIESTRKSDWDYSNSGFYFITICTKDRINYFGEIFNGKMILSDIGKIAEQCLIDIPKHFPHTRLDEFIVMPNHVHFIVEILYNANAIDNVETQNFASLQLKPQPKPQPQQLQQKPKQPPSKSTTKNHFGPQSKNLSSIVRGYKIGVKKWTTENKIIFDWQPRFYDIIINNENSLKNIRNYIKQNPENWNTDEYK